MFCSYLVFRALELLVRGLTLTLLVTRVVADNHDATVATNDFALIANLLNAWVNLHEFFPFYL
jgi:hypothetical protein